jgi:hypothetical protein
MNGPLEQFYGQFHDVEVPAQLVHIDVPSLEKRRTVREITVCLSAFVLAWVLTSAPTWTAVSVQPSFAWTAVLSRQLDPVASLDAEAGK